jgi:serine/threonine protein kinase/WD40 repeat protein
MATNQSNTWQDKMLGRYRMLRMLGRGGMGEVWLAEDTQLLRQVAIKLLPTVQASERSYLEDFEREARAIASLEHPHILPVHDFGEQVIADDEIVTYLIIPYMTGGTLRDRILQAQGPLPVDEALNYLRQAAEAIDYAHSQQVLHRDIKPANMLLQQDWLFLADFGLAKLLTGTTRRTRTYAGAGTPEYMAPEQAQGKAEFASDRYSFAVTAYQLFTGKVPFKGETPYGTLMQHITAEPPPPRQFNPQLPTNVEEVILQGLAKQPAQRPVSCMAMVDALERCWHTGTAIPADPDATLLTPWSRRRAEDVPSSQQHISTGSAPSQSPSGQSAADFPATVLASQAPETPQLYPHNAPTYISGEAPAASPEREARTPETSHHKITRRTLLTTGAGALVAAGGATALYTFLRSHSSPAPAVSHPSIIAGPKKIMAGVPILSLTGHTKDVNVARWDPTGRYLLTGAQDSSVMLWDIASATKQSSTGVQSIPTPLRRWQLPSQVFPNKLCWFADGKTIAIATGDTGSPGNNKIYLFDAFSNSDTPHIYQDKNAANSSSQLTYCAIACSPTANVFATPRYIPQQTRQLIDLWQVNQADRPARTLTSDASGRARTLIIDEVHIANEYVNVNMISWSPDGKALAAHTNFGTVTVWQAATGAITQTLSMPARPIGWSPIYVLGEYLAWSPANPHLLAASNIDAITLWDIQQNRQVGTLESSLVLSADNLAQLKKTSSYTAVSGLAWSPNGRYLAASLLEVPVIYVWDTQKLGQPTPLKPLLYFPHAGSPGHTATITDVAWSPDGRYIASASGDTTVLVWKVDAA